MTPPTKPSRWTRKTLVRSAAGVLQGFLLVWLVALVAWPEQHVLLRSDGWAFSLESGASYPQDGRLIALKSKPAADPRDTGTTWWERSAEYGRDSSLSVLLPFLAQTESYSGSWRRAW